MKAIGRWSAIVALIGLATLGYPGRVAAQSASARCNPRVLTASLIAKALGARQVTEKGPRPESSITCEFLVEAAPKQPTELSSFPVFVLSGRTDDGSVDFPGPDQCPAVIAQIVGAATPPQTVPVKKVGEAACRSGVGSTQEPLVGVAYKSIKGTPAYAVLIVYVGTFESVLKSLGARPAKTSLTELLKQGVKRL
jgi:hypothetical protein